MIPPLLRAVSEAVQILPTEAPRFLMTPTALANALDFDVLILTHPANPSGAAYAPEILRSLIQASAARGARVILDEVFGLLADLDGPLPVHQDRLAALSEKTGSRVLILCGVSKEFAAGGLRLGMAASPDTDWLAEMAALRPAALPQHLLVVAKALFQDFEAHLGEVEQMRATLRARRNRLAAGLRDLGFGVQTQGRGGLFLLADTSELDGGDPESFTLRLESEAGVRLNTPAWSGLARHARACFAVPEARIDQALERLRRHLS